MDELTTDDDQPTLSQDARKKLKQYEPGLFNSFSVPSTLSIRGTTFHVRWQALFGLAVIFTIHLHSLYHYGWKPVINTPFFVVREPIVFGLYVFVWVYTAYQIAKWAQVSRWFTDVNDEAIQHSWYAWWHLRRGNINNAVTHWNHAKYRIKSGAYTGPNELRDLVRDYYDAPNQVEVLREELPGALEDASGAGIKETLFQSQNFPHEYQEVVTEINRCYNTGSYSSATIMVRKLVENLIIDILRMEYGDDEPEKYFNTDTGRLHNLSTLINNLEESTNALKKYSGRVTSEEFQKSLEKSRTRANKEAHSVDVNRTQKELEQYVEESRMAVMVLVRIRRRLAEKAESYRIDEQIHNEEQDYDPESAGVGEMFD